MLLSRAEDDAGEEKEDEKDEGKKHYLTFQVSYFGSARRSQEDEFRKSETSIDVNNRFTGRIEVRPTEAYDLPAGRSAAAQLQQMAAMQAAVAAGDAEALKAATPALLVTWFPRGSEVEITGTISETMRSSSANKEWGESRAKSDRTTETYRGQKVFPGDFGSAFVRIRPEEKKYDLQFTLMPDMAATWEAVHQALIRDHKEAGHDHHEESEARLPLDAGPSQLGLGYSNYQIVAEVKGQPLAGEANELIGTTRIPVPKPAGWDGSWDIAMLVSWQIDVTLPPLELVITAPGYDAWRPEGNIKQPTAPGNKLVARATLQPKTAEKGFVPRVKHIRFELLDTSREPGICLNWPLNVKDHDYDLRLAAVAGGKLGESDQSLEVDDPKRDDKGQAYAEVQIDSYDFGGRASLRAVCLLTDGREIEGVMKDVGEMPRVPKMAKPGWIADSWRKAHQAEQLADDDDGEKVKNQKEDGDGYTLYEEYRGWVMNEKRVEGDPKRKDFFVLNRVGRNALPGIELFEQLSQLRVHSKLRLYEMSPQDRLMNGNHRDGPRRVDQHGVWIKTMSRSELGDTGAITRLTKTGVAGRPGLVEGVGLLARSNSDSLFNKPFNLPAQDAMFAYDRAIAHELLHTVGVEHHGSGDGRQIIGYVSPRNPHNKVGRPYYAASVDGRPLVLLDEAGHDVAQKDYAGYVKLRELMDMVLLERTLKEGAEYIQRNGASYNPNVPSAQAYADLQIELLTIYCFMHLGGQVGVQHGEHSGDQDCVMRYYFAKFYESVGRSDSAQYLVTPGTERIGLEICHSVNGTGVNAPKPPNLPQSRYGNAAATDGDCFAQICPNDAIPPRATK